MARRPKDLPEADNDMATDWPVTETYTNKDGIIVKVYKAAHAVMSSNKFSARPRRNVDIIGV